VVIRVAHLVTCIAGLLLVACASTPGRFPELNESALVDVVAVVRFRGGVYLQQSPVCNRADVICGDPPPFELRAEVVRHLFGPSLPAVVSFAGTSHYGIPKHAADELALIHLVTDGASMVMPRYHWERVGEDSRGNLVIPAYPEETWWLPCGVNAQARAVQFRLPRGRFSGMRKDFDEEALATHADFFVIDRQSVRPRLGIPIDALAEFLRGHQSFARGGEPVCESE
jgi:hypothetical protein